METLSREQQKKYDRLVKDIETFKCSAKKTGKSLEKYLTDLNLESEIAAKLAVKGQEINGVAENRMQNPTPTSEQIKPCAENKEYITVVESESKMKVAIIERLLDIVKWVVIIIVVSAAFYLLYPKYFFSGPQGLILYRCNSINGQIEEWDHLTRSWTFLK